jgi:mRNA interferase MazF
MEGIKRKQIRYADLGTNKGRRQNGKRPVLIIQNDMGNKYSPTTLVVPLTTNTKDNYPFQVKLSSAIYNLKADSTVMCEQVTVLDKTDIFDCLDEVSDLHMRKIEEAIRISLGMEGEDDRATS